MAYLVRLAALSGLAFACMSSYVVIAERYPSPEEVEEAHVAGPQPVRRLRLFLSGERSPQRSEAGKEQARNQEAPGLAVEKAPSDSAREHPAHAVPSQKESQQKKEIRQTAESRLYVVKKGDTLGEIAVRMLGSTRFVRHIVRANPVLRRRKVLQVGQVLVLPVELTTDETTAAPSGEPPGAVRRKPKKTSRGSSRKFRTVVVRKGDTLYGLARRYLGSGAKWRELLVVNRAVIRDCTRLRPGVSLRVPLRPGAR